MLMEQMNQLELVSYVLVVIGALNWGLEGLGSFAGTELNLVSLLAGTVGVDVLAPAVYVLVGLAGLYQVYFGYQLNQG